MPDMWAIRLYDLETGHVETLAEVAGAELARSWLQAFAVGGIGTSDVVYTVELPEHDAGEGLRTG